MFKCCACNKKREKEKKEKKKRKKRKKSTCELNLVLKNSFDLVIIISGEICTPPHNKVSKVELKMRKLEKSKRRGY